MNKLKQVDNLENGNGIQYLLDAANKIFHNPIVMFDTNYSLIAYTDVVVDDPLWNELISTGTFSIKTQEFFAREFFTEEVANADKYVILRSDELKYDRISGYIFNRDNIKVASIVMVICDNLFEEDELAAFDKLADKIISEIQDDEYFTAFGRAYHGEIITKLLDRVIRDPLIHTGQVQILYDGFDDYLYVAVVDLTHNNLQQNSIEYFRDLLESMYRLFKFAIYSGYVVMIMSSKSKLFHKEFFFEKHNNPFEQNNLYVGISSNFESLYELREYYDQAVSVLIKGIESNCDQRIFSYDNV